MNKQAEVRQILEGVSTGGLSVDEGVRELGIVGVVIQVVPDDSPQIFRAVEPLVEVPDE